MVLSRTGRDRNLSLRGDGRRREDGSVAVAHLGQCLERCLPRQIAPTVRTQALKTCQIRAEFGGVQLWPAGDHGLRGCGGGGRELRELRFPPFPALLMCRENLSELPCSPHCFSIENNLSHIGLFFNKDVFK